jgi:hypothetical protein
MLCKHLMISAKPVEIPRVQPHNLALAKDSLDYISYFAEPFSKRYLSHGDAPLCLDDLAIVAEKEINSMTEVQKIDFAREPCITEIENSLRAAKSRDNALFYAAYRFFSENPIRLLQLDKDEYFNLDGDHRLFVFHSLGQTYYPFAIAYDIRRPDDRREMAEFLSNKAKGYLRKEGISEAHIELFFQEVDEYASPEYLRSMAVMGRFIRDEMGIRTVNDLRERIYQKKEDIKQAFDTRFADYRLKILGNA